MNRFLSVLLFLFSCSFASAQSVQQSGSVTPGHAVQWLTNGIVGDAGTAANGFLTSLGVVAGGPAICQNSGPVTGPYQSLCLSVTTGGPGQIIFQNHGGAAPQALQVVINGIAYALPFTGAGGNIVNGPGSSVINDLACWANTTGNLINDCASFNGTTNKVGTISGALTNGHCVSIDANGNLVDAGGPCTTGGGGGTVNSGSANNLTYYVTSGNAVSGLANGSAGLPLIEGTPPSWAALSNSGLATMNANTVKCNNTGSSATPIDCTATQAVNMLSTAAWNDTSAVVGSYASYWTTSGAAVVGLFNRLFIGEATKNNKGNDSVGPYSWVEGLIPLVASSQFAVGNTVGQISVSGYTRASDGFTASGNHNNINALGLVGFGYHDDTSGTGTQFIQGATLIAAMKAGVTTGSAIATQIDINNAAASPAVHPNSLTPNGATIGVLITSGAYAALATTQVGAAHVIGLGRGGGPTFNAGIVIGSGTIASTSVGSLGTFPRAIEMPAGYGITWFGSGTTEVGGWYVNSSGNWTIAVTSLSMNGSTGVNCSGSPSGAFATINGIVTHC